MKTLHFSRTINAPVELVWETMLDDATYREWTSVLSPGSYFEGSWLPGSEIRFIGGSENGSKGGMVGRIAEHRPHEFVSIEYFGLIVDGVEDTTSEDAQRWAGTHENYTFSEADGVTTVAVDLDVDDPLVELFEDMWPKFLDKIAELAEAEAVTHGRHPAP